jgi:hypothetical protein
MRQAALALMLLLPGPASADGAVTVPLPDLSQVPDKEIAPLLLQLVEAVVIGENCPDWQSSPGQWALLYGAAQDLTARLGLDIEAADRGYWDPAFALLDQPGHCAQEGPQIAPLVARLQALGGSVVPIK